MAENKKISELGRRTALGGEELLVVAQGGENYSVTAQTLKENAQQGMVAAVEGKGLSSNDYTEEDKQKLDALPTADELEGKLGAAKLALFVDMWTRCYDCTYDATKTEKPFRCNRVDLTYEEAIAVYNAPRLCWNNPGGFASLLGAAKTIILGSGNTNGAQADISSLFQSATNLETIRVSAGEGTAFVRGMAYVFYACMSLRTIIGKIGLTYTGSPTTAMFSRCIKLEDVNISGLKVDISFGDSPLLSLASVQFLVANAANTAAITVTVHADVYAKLTGDTTNEAAAALTEEELAAWGQVLTDAAARNISFASA